MEFMGVSIGGVVALIILVPFTVMMVWANAHRHDDRRRLRIEGKKVKRKKLKYAKFRLDK